MKIAELSWESLHSVHVGGLGVHVSELSKSLASLGHEVHLFTQRAPHQLEVEVIDSVTYHRVHLPVEGTFPDRIVELNRGFTEAVLATAVDGPFDIVHGHDWLSAQAVHSIKEATGAAAVHTIHSTEYGRCGNNFYEGESAEVRAIERSGVADAAAVIAVSSALRDEVLWMYEAPPEKVVVIGNGVSMEEYETPTDTLATRREFEIGEEAPMVLFVGRMVQQKGPDLLIEAMPMLLRQFPDLVVVFVGDGFLLDSMGTRVHELGIASSVRFTGYDDDGIKLHLAMASDVQCVPSRNEPFGIVVLEAWAAGMPVVASRRGGPAEFVTDGVDGVLIDPDPISIAEGLARVLLEPDRGRSMGERGHKAAAKFSWDAIAERVVHEVFEPLVGSDA